MSTLEDINQMKKQGMSEQQIKDSLKVRGLSDAEITNSLSQSQIKSAVQQDKEFPVPKSQFQGEGSESTPDQYNRQMQKSIMPPRSNSGNLPYQQDQTSPNENQTAPQEYSPQLPQNSQQYTQPPMPQVTEYSPQNSQESQYDQYQEYSPQLPQNSQQGYGEYQPYQSYSTGPSADLISEVSEQIVSEKLSQVRKSFEKAMDAKNTLGAKIDYIEERLKRIEKIIDTLQSSVLRKVGDYVTDVQDIKHELIETQKSMAKAFPKLKEHAHKSHKKTKHKKK